MEAKGGGGVGFGGGGRGGPTPDEPWAPPYCMVVAVDLEDFFYRVCSICERTLPVDPFSICRICSHRSTSNPGSKLLYRLLISIGTVDRVIVVVCFDRAARAIMGCSADELLQLFRVHPSAAEEVEELLEGEMFKMTLSQSKKGNAEHLRVSSVVPLDAGFRPVIERLRKILGAAGAETSSNNN